MKTGNKWIMVAGLVLAAVVFSTCVLADDDYPLQTNFSGTYTLNVKGTAADGRATVDQLVLVQAQAPDGRITKSLVTATLAGYTFVKGDVEGENAITAEFDLEFRNADGRKVELDGHLVLEGENIKLYGEWEENDIETRMTGQRLR